jgi:OHS family lactose permease-like MFS transporter
VDYYRHVSDVCAVLFIFGPLLQYNILVGSIVGGIYLGFCFNAGAPAVEAFIEKVSRRSNFEYGRARMFGCVGWALCASITIMFTINNQFVFWLGSGCAFILAVLLFFAKTDAPSSATVANAVGANHSAFSLRWRWNCSDSQNCGFCHCMLLAFPAPTMFLTNSLLISLLRSLLPVNRVRGYLAT